MSFCNDKSGYWLSQFETSFPMVLARFWAERNLSVISADFDTLDVHRMMGVTQGSYAKEDLGRAMVEMHGYHERVAQECQGEGLMQDFARRVLDLERVRGELSAVVGELIFNGAPGFGALRTTFPGKMSEIRKEAAKHKAVKGVMST